MRLSVGSAMSDRVVGCDGKHMVYALEVVHAVVVCDVFRSSEHIENRSMNALEALFVRHRHTWNCSGTVYEESDVANHAGLKSLVGCVAQCLETSAGHSGSGYVLCVKLIEVWTCRVSIDFFGPVDTFNLLL